LTEKNSWLQYDIYFTRQIQIFGFVSSFFLSPALKIIEENCKKFEVMKKFWRVKYVKNFSRQIEKG